MPGVVELIDRAVDLPPGPQLSALLAELPWAQVPNARLVEVLQTRSRQLAHEQAGLLAGWSRSPARSRSPACRGRRWPAPGRMSSGPPTRSPPP